VSTEEPAPAEAPARSETALTTPARCERCGTPAESALCAACEAGKAPRLGWRLFDVPWGMAQVLSQGDLLPLAIAPILLSGAVLTISLFLGYGWLNRYITTWLAQSMTPGTGSSLLQALASTLGVVGAVLIFGFLFLPLLGLVCMPFFDPLVSKLEKRQLGERPTVPLKLGVLLREMVLLLILKLALLIPSLFLLGVPVLGPVLFTLVLTMVLSLDFLDILWMRRGYSFSAKVGFLSRNFVAWLLYLAPLLLIVWIPLLQLLMLPGAAAGAWRFYLSAKK
jgi:CysZ protein